jgi:hypothetical protein
MRSNVISRLALAWVAERQDAAAMAQQSGKWRDMEAPEIGEVSIMKLVFAISNYRTVIKKATDGESVAFVELRLTD